MIKIEVHWRSLGRKPTDAVQSTVEIQEAVAQRNASAAEDKRLQIRAGINLGEIIFEGDDIYGTGVNVAARLESIAEPGGICISNSVYDQIQGILSLGYEDIFDLQDKITESVVGVIEPQIRKAEIERSRHKPPENLDAYDLYLRALPHVYAFRPEANSAALATGSDDATAVATAGFVLLVIGHDYDTALLAIRRAAESNPNNALVLQWAGFANVMAGDATEATTYFQRAHRLSPADPGAFFFLTGEAWAQFSSGRFAEAAELAARSVATYSDWDTTYWVLAAAYAHLGRLDEAKAAVAKVLELSPGLTLSRLRETVPIKDQARLAAILDGPGKARLPGA